MAGEVCSWLITVLHTATCVSLFLPSREAPEFSTVLSNPNPPRSNFRQQAPNLFLTVTAHLTHQRVVGAVNVRLMPEHGAEHISYILVGSVVALPSLIRSFSSTP